MIRPERLGDPIDAMQLEQIDVPDPGPGEVLVRVMAAGVNYNGVWASLGLPVSIFRYTGYDFHIAGSDASGIVERVGPGVTRWSPGDEVVIHCNQSCGECAECNGLDPMACSRQKIWAYETNWGSFAEYCLVQSQQLLRKPARLTWEEAASYGLTYFTAYRMLVDRAGMRAGDNVLVWGAGGGLGTFAVQLCRLYGANAIAVVSSDDKRELVTDAGRVGGARPARVRAPRPRHGRAQLRRDQAVRKGDQGGHRRLRRRHRVRARRRGHVLHLGLRLQDVRDDRDLRRHLGIPARLRRALPVDAPEDDPREPLRERLRVPAGQPADRRGQDRAGAVAGLPLVGVPRAAPDDEGERRTSGRWSCSSGPSARARAAAMDERPFAGPGRRVARLRPRPRRPRVVPVHARHPPRHVRRPAVVDPPVRRLRHGRRDQPPLPVPDRPGPARPLDGVRPPDADGPRLRRPAGRRARSGGWASRSTRSATWRRCSTASRSTRSRPR